jgi:hypothetical protein
MTGKFIEFLHFKFLRNILPILVFDDEREAAEFVFVGGFEQQGTSIDGVLDKT